MEEKRDNVTVALSADDRELLDQYRTIIQPTVPPGLRVPDSALLRCALHHVMGLLVTAGASGAPAEEQE